MINAQITCPENSITVFRSLIASLDFSHLEDPQRYDLSALASESAEGLCHGLLCLSEGLENSEIIPPAGVPQISAYLKATAHLLPLLFELHERASDGLGEAKKLTASMMR
jgi:hypothetical protein